MLAQRLFARWANILPTIANIFAGTAQYLPAWLNISRNSSIFASMANILDMLENIVLCRLIFKHTGKYISPPGK
jgi:hypothetical protein